MAKPTSTADCLNCPDFCVGIPNCSSCFQLEDAGYLIIEPTSTATTTQYEGISAVFGFGILIILLFTLIYRILKQEK